MSDSQSKTHRACTALTTAAAAYPEAWKKGELYRSVNGQPGKPSWQSWCFLPLGGWYAIVAHARHGGSEIKDLASLLDVSRLAALGAWRMTQGIYRYAPALQQSLWQDGVDAETQADVLLGLPQWCVYLALDGVEPGLHGAWAHLEHDANTGTAELRLLLDEDSGLTPMALDLGKIPLAQAVEQAIERSARELQRNQPKLDADMRLAGQQHNARVLKGVTAMLAHLCSASVQFARKGESARPANPAARRTKQGQRVFAAAGPTEWTVG